MKNPTAYLKMRVLGAIETAEGNSITARIKNVSQTSFTDEDGHPRLFTWRTIQTWYSRFKKHGVTSMENTPRSDRGKTRKVSHEQLLEAVRAVLPLTHTPRASRHAGPPTRALLYRLCIEKGLLTRSQVAPNTFTRLARELELLKPDAQCENRRRLAFAKPHANDLWQADTMFGPFVQTPDGPAQARLISFVDDASRVCCHGEFFMQENTTALIAALRSALYKRGVPSSLYVDHGSPYVSREIMQICARLGCILLHAPVRDGAAKGKVERYHRTVRLQFLSRQLDLSSLDALNRAFTHWVEEHYNAQPHSILGMSPLERFALDRNRIRFLQPNETNDELFFVEEERHVRADNTFFFRASRYEAPRHLPERKIQIRHRRGDKAPDAPVIVYYKNERMGAARLVNLVANDRKPPRSPAPPPPPRAAQPQNSSEKQPQTPEAQS
ncbi:MAG: DDE-type integrase/transposase/recombinase [Kiritimatiellaeota bacterium]|nr:DDE-type integrase/transposase/recombinase [Kiritimatiellota bacterium]